MIKTILSLNPTQHIHPAVGRLFEIIFTDNTTGFTYEETFFDEVDGYIDNRSQGLLIGKQISTRMVYSNSPM
jgi:hypothetical protein